MTQSLRAVLDFNHDRVRQPLFSSLPSCNGHHRREQESKLSIRLNHHPQLILALSSRAKRHV